MAHNPPIRLFCSGLDKIPKSQEVLEFLVKNHSIFKKYSYYAPRDKLTKQINFNSFYILENCYSENNSDFIGFTYDYSRTPESNFARCEVIDFKKMCDVLIGKIRPITIKLNIKITEKSHNLEKLV